MRTYPPIKNEHLKMTLNHNYGTKSSNESQIVIRRLVNVMKNTYLAMTYEISYVVLTCFKTVHAGILVIQYHSSFQRHPADYFYLSKCQVMAVFLSLSWSHISQWAHGDRFRCLQEYSVDRVSHSSGCIARPKVGGGHTPQEIQSV